MSENKRLFVGRKKVEDRFTIISDYDDEIGVKENQSGDVIVLKHNDLNAQQFVAQLVLFLNDQNQAIVDLYDGCEYWSDKASERITLLEKENEKLKKEKEFWKGDACNCSNYLSILSMDCQIVQEAIYDLKNVIDVDTEASKLLDKLDDKFDELNQHRIKMYSR